MDEEEFSKLFSLSQAIAKSEKSWVLKNPVTGVVHEGFGEAPLPWGQYPEGVDPDGTDGHAYDMVRGDYYSIPQAYMEPGGLDEIKEQSQDSVTSDPLWATASKVLYNYLNPQEYGRENTDGRSRRGTSEGQISPGSFMLYDDSEERVEENIEKDFTEYANWGVDFISLFENNLSAMAIDTAQLMNAPIEVHRAMYYMMESADRKGVKWSNVGKAFAGLATDPFTYLGLGTLGIGLAGKKGGQKLTKMAFKDMLKNSVRLVQPTKVSALASAEGALYMGAFDLARQNVEVNAEIKDEIDKTQLGTSAALGAGMGQGLTRVVDAAPQILKNVGDAIVDAGDAAKARMAEGGTQLNTGLDVDPLLAAAGDLVGGNNTPPGPELDYEGFTSQALEVTKGLNQKKGTGQQFKSQLLKGGVKQDEIDWLGLDEVLNKDKVTKEEIEQHIRDNRVELDTFELSASPESQTLTFDEPTIMSPDEVWGPGYGEEQMFENYLEGSASFDEIKQSILETSFDETTKNKTILKARSVYFDERNIQNMRAQFEPDEIAVLEEAGNRLYNDVYYMDPDEQVIKQIDSQHGYVITGNDELGYSIFENEAQSRDGRNNLATTAIYSKNEAQLQLEEILFYDGLLTSSSEITRFHNHTQPGGTNYRELLLTYPDSKQPYNQSHFDDFDNVLAHMRVSDRLTLDDKKVLYAEEIQSDWGQQGRGNFRLSNKELEELEEKRKKAQIIYDKYAKQRKDTGKDIEGAELDEANAAIEFLQQTSETKRLNINKIPQAPFVTSTDKWTQLTIKKLLANAVQEGNYDYVAISPGKIQFDRWNKPGLRDYYDKVIPKNVNKVVKKLDKDAVEKIDMVVLTDNQPTLAIKLTDTLKEKVKKGQALFSVPAAVTAGAIASQGENDGN